MFRTLAVTALFASQVLAQTWTACSPLNSTCPDDNALGTTFADDYNSTTAGINKHFWNVTAGLSNIGFSNAGAALSVARSGDSVTLQSNFYIMWGTVEILMRAAPGQGIISTVVLLSDDLDEIDIEIMGGNTTTVESNWYGHGNQSQMNALYHPCDGPQESIHNYTIDWRQDKTDWWIDGNLARTLPYDESGLYPQTPSFIRFGIWAGGDKTQQEGTIQWAGGPTDWSKGPFAMLVQSIKITDGTSNVTSYSYTDHSGNFQSIKSTPGVSAAAHLISIKDTSYVASASQKWNGLSTGAKIGIGAGVGCLFAVAFAAFVVFWCAQRKSGRVERELEDQKWDQQNAELMAYRQQMAKGAFAISHMGHGEKR